MNVMYPFCRLSNPSVDIFVSLIYNDLNKGEIIMHCKNCVFHWDGGRTPKYKDWCTKYSKTAPKAVGHCKLNNGKQSRV